MKTPTRLTALPNNDYFNSFTTRESDFFWKKWIQMNIKGLRASAWTYVRPRKM